MPSNMTDHDRIVEMHTDIGYIKKKITRQCDLLDDHNRRINRLESWKDKVNGALGVVGLLIGAIWAKILKWL